MSSRASPGGDGQCKYLDHTGRRKICGGNIKVPRLDRNKPLIGHVKTQAPRRVLGWFVIPTFLFRNLKARTTFSPANSSPDKVSPAVSAFQSSFVLEYLLPRHKTALSLTRPLGSGDGPPRILIAAMSFYWLRSLLLYINICCLAKPLHPSR